MPIDLTCSCGKKATVKDELAGKKGKCPACGNVLTVPVPSAPDSEESAFALLMEAEAEVAKSKSEPPEPSAGKKSHIEVPEPIPLAAGPPPAKKPKKAKKKEINYEAIEEPRSSGPPRIVISPGVMAAVGMILCGGLITAMSVDSGRAPIYGVILMLVGGFRLIQGLMGAEEE
jgi:hypothetical protein